MKKVLIAALCTTLLIPAFGIDVFAAELADEPADVVTEKEEITESLDISGTGMFLQENISSQSDSVGARGIGVNAGNQFTDAGTIDYRFSDTIISDTVVLNGAVSVSISSIEYRLKMDVGVRETTVEDFYFAVNNTVDVSADFSLRTDGKSGGSIELGTVPFVLGGTGIDGELIFWLTYDVNGNITVDYRLSNRMGLTLKDGLCVPFAENESMTAFASGVKFSAGPKMRFILKFGKNIRILDVTLDGGLTGMAGASLNGSGPVEEGYDLDAWLYLNMKPEGKSVVSSVLGLKPASIWNYDTSPFHKVQNGSWQSGS